MSLAVNFGRFKLFKFKLKLVLDIGAQTGIFSKNLYTLYPDCRFVLFEPNKECNLHLIKTEFEFYNWLLYYKPDVSIKFYIDKENKISTGNSIYLEQSEKFSQKNYKILKTKILDQFVCSDPVDLIKLDVQGAELDVLNGAKKILKQTKFVLIETSLKHYNLNAPLESEIINHMAENGFKNFILFDQHKWVGPNNQIIDLLDGEVFQNDLLFISNKSSKVELIRFKLLKLYINFKNSL